ncbi:MAG: hypothetical protein HY841_13870 [Bacteroidetes bacterium]|nr:hypothetical protein [Bacteroidota bacterium]
MENIDLIITAEDRVQYSADTNGKELTLAIKQQEKFLAIRKPIDLPRLPTISDIKIEGGLTKEDEEIISNLSERYISENKAKINFENITQQELRELQKYSDVAQKMTRDEIWKIIKPYFSLVFRVPLFDKFPKMKEIEKRMQNADVKGENYAPTMEWLGYISQQILFAKKDLFRFNIDFRARMFDYKDKPIDFLLMLLKAQKEMYPKRKGRLTDTFSAKFESLIQSHAELMVKLKMENRRAEDFFGSTFNKIKDDLRVLKNILYQFISGGKPLSIKQQMLLIRIIDEYTKSLEMIFAVSPDERNFFEKELNRPEKNTELAMLEIYHTFDDSPITTKRYNLQSKSYVVTACEIINSIYFNFESEKTIMPIYKNGISLPNLKQYLTQYFSFEKSDRPIIRQKTLKRLDRHKNIVGNFFDVIEKY